MATDKAEKDTRVCECLNVTQLLVNFGLDSVSQLTPEQFTLLCPALLYQIDSRVCIQHSDEVTLPPPGGALWPALGWGLLAVTFVSLPSALAVVLVPLLSRGFFRSLLAFLVALAVGTLCGDALLHLWPHAQGRHQETPAELGAAVLQGLAVLGGIYLLFLVELLLGMLRRSREATGCSPGETPDVAVGVLAPLRGGAELRHLTAPEPELELKPYGHPHGHSHEHSHGPALPPSPRATDIVWMVVLGDGIHNLTDGLAIGRAATAFYPTRTNSTSNSIHVFRRRHSSEGLTPGARKLVAGLRTDGQRWPGRAEQHGGDLQHSEAPRTDATPGN
ncbi:PREDICTED: zinc transporter ZIP5 [Aptenodytes forsteri]|uniref:zinc transporter ZIP5 n=1 Tax=Aptenodytes forsteri TaxID=9233 RepID=UPI000904908A|nr:PREDICTED: zinc transporter ZIP5 [Aptenodytes forsteri]